MSDVSGPPASAARHLKVLRGLLTRDTVGRADWDQTLRDLARMAQEAIAFSAALVAQPGAEPGSWSAVTGDGQRLGNPEISRGGLHGILEKVRETGKPLFQRDEPESVLAVPIQFWDVTAENSTPRLGACLVLRRSRGEEPFGEEDLGLIQDIALIVQPTLNLLRHAANLEATLLASREELKELRQAAREERQSLGDYETHDPAFGKNVLSTLRRVASAGKVGLLILGPTGSGKNHLARAYHDGCPRREGPFVTLDCAQVTSADTLTAELFGYALNSGFANAPPKGRPGKAQLAPPGHALRRRDRVDAGRPAAEAAAPPPDGTLLAAGLERGVLRGHPGDRGVEREPAPVRQGEALP